MPLVLKRSRAVFLHVPKTGGTWVRFALQRALVPWEDYGNQHLNADESKDLFPDSLRFCVVRNPFDWYKSYWATCKLEGWGGEWLIGHDCVARDFPTFIRLVTTKHPGFLSDLYRSYTNLPRYDITVLRTEALRPGLSAMLVNLEEQFDREKLHSTPRVNPGAFLPCFRDLQYDRDMVAMVLESERYIFDKYGYAAGL